MAGWSADELAAIDRSDELDLQSQRADGSLRDPVTMWVAIDGAYRTKYRNYADNIVATVTNAQARGATIQLVPR